MPSPPPRVSRESPCLSCTPVCLWAWSANITLDTQDLILPFYTQPELFLPTYGLCCLMTFNAFTWHFSANV